MDKLDSLLLEAWNRISAKVRADRVSALKRSRRRFKGVLTRPMREWCLVIRASDARINDYRAIVEASPDADFSHNPIESHQPHTVTLDGRLIRELTRPVKIPWPGVTYQDPADLCGREYQTIVSWVRAGVFKVDYYREFGFPEHTSRTSGKALGSGGGRPYVWTPSPIDVNNCTGRTPHPVWGTLWQWLWEDFPEDFALTVERVPRLCMFRGDMRFRGWRFICPGRANAHGEHQPCGRQCTYLYAPQTVWTLAKAIGDGSGEGFEMPEDSGLAGQWFPGMSDTVAQPGTRRFACKKCWGVESMSTSHYDGWNRFVAHLSGGLLYGREVPRPLDIFPIVRKRRPYTRRRRKARETPAALPAMEIAARA